MCTEGNASHADRLRLLCGTSRLDERTKNSHPKERAELIFNSPDVKMLNTVGMGGRPIGQYCRKTTNLEVIHHPPAKTELTGCFSHRFGGVSTVLILGSQPLNFGGEGIGCTDLSRCHDSRSRATEQHVTPPVLIPFRHGTSAPGAPDCRQKVAFEGCNGQSIIPITRILRAHALNSTRGAGLRTRRIHPCGSSCSGYWKPLTGNRTSYDRLKCQLEAYHSYLEKEYVCSEYPSSSQITNESWSRRSIVQGGDRKQND